MSIIYHFNDSWHYLKLLNFSVKCNDLLFNDSLTVMGYSQPAIVGSYVTFSCPLGMELIGPNSTTCMENGEWEPDPKKLECKGLYNIIVIIIIHALIIIILLL